MTHVHPRQTYNNQVNAPPPGVFLAPPLRWWLKRGRCGGVEVHAVRHADSSLRLGLKFYLHRVFFFFPSSLPCNYAAAKCLSATSGWSRHFLPHVHRPGRRTSPPLVLLPQQTSLSENLPENNLLYYIITFTSNSYTSAALPRKAITICHRCSKRKTNHRHF